MEKTSNSWTVASLVALVFLVLFPVRSWCLEDSYTLQTEPGCCVGAYSGWKRFGDVDDDTFVSLMGRRSAAQPNRQVDRMLAALLGRKTRMACPCAEEASRTRRGVLVDQGKQRVQRFL